MRRKKHTHTLTRVQMDTKIDSQIIFGVMVCTEGEQDNVSHMEACCGVWNSV